MDVARARRRVENQVVESTPVGVADELFQRPRGHTTAPERCRLRVNEEAYAQQLHAILLNGNNQVATILVDGIRTGILHAEHLCHRRTEDVAVQQSHAIAQPSQRDGEVCRHRRLAHTALA